MYVYVYMCITLLHGLFSEPCMCMYVYVCVLMHLLRFFAVIFVCSVCFCVLAVTHPYTHRMENGSLKVSFNIQSVLVHSRDWVGLFKKDEVCISWLCVFALLCACVCVFVSLCRI